MDFIGLGSSGIVYHLRGTRRVCKSPHDVPLAQEMCAVEVEIYKRLQVPHRPSSVLDYYGSTQDGIILEWAAHGSIRQYQRKITALIPERLLYRWACQAAQALTFCHSRGVLHGDIHCNNFFLDERLNLKLGDFAGSSIDGSPGTVCYSVTHQLPDVDEQSTSANEATITEMTEIFAFGSALYEMVTGRGPYAGDFATEVFDSEVESHFRNKQFPDVTGLRVLGKIIAGCWNLDFSTMAEVLECVETEGTTSNHFPESESLTANSQLAMPA